MDKQLYTVTAVEYLNTALFVAGLRNASLLSGPFRLILDHPAGCSNRMISGEADIGLVPVASLSTIRPKFIFGDYCIGATGEVRTVRLLAQSPVHELQQIYLDAHSRTSVRLLEVLCRDYWKAAPDLLPSAPGFEQQPVPEKAGILVIGDKVFAVEDQFAFSYDLAEQWIQYTGTDFVFAVWVSNTDMDSGLIRAFKQALSLGLQDTEETIRQLKASPVYRDVAVEDYLNRNISYVFDDRKRNGMELFLTKAGLSVPDLRYK